MLILRWVYEIRNSPYFFSGFTYTLRNRVSDPNLWDKINVSSTERDDVATACRHRTSTEE